MPGPFNRSYTIQKMDAAFRNYTAEKLVYTWSTSPFTLGRLQLVPNAMSRYSVMGAKVSIVGHVGFAPSLSTDPPPYADSHWNALRLTLRDVSYSVLMSKLRGDTAGLGVTFGSWNQTSSMVGSRARLLASFARFCVKKALPKGASKAKIVKARREARLFWLKYPTGRKLKRPRPKDVRHGSSADLFLEGFFGWLPLLEDMHNAYKAMASDLPFGYVSGSARSPVSESFFGAYDSTSAIGSLSVKQTAMFRVTNPNAWLLNKLGLVNPLVVAWDLIPWSFMVNRIVNVNSFLGSFTDTFGLSVSGASRTERLALFQTATKMNTYPKSHPFWAQTSMSERTWNKSRVLTPLTPPRLTVRAPGFSLSQGIIDASLATQQVRRLRST